MIGVVSNTKMEGELGTGLSSLSSFFCLRLPLFKNRQDFFVTYFLPFWLDPMSVRKEGRRSGRMLRTKGCFVFNRVVVRPIFPSFGL